MFARHTPYIALGLCVMYVRLPSWKLWCHGTDGKNPVRRLKSGKVNLTLLGLWVPSMDASKSVLPLSSARSKPASQRQEVRCAVRFPLALPVMLSSGKKEIAAVTQNVSASGVAFEIDSSMQTGMEIRFSLRMPSAVLGTPHDVLVQCRGRVVRCSMNQSNYLAAATIDDYQFAEQ